MTDADRRAIAEVLWEHRRELLRRGLAGWAAEAERLARLVEGLPSASGGSRKLSSEDVCQTK